MAFDPGGATASRIAMPHMLPSTVPSVSASAKLLLSWLNPPPHPITVYASHPPSPTTAQHSLPGGALPPYRGRSFTGRIASASPDAPEPEVRIHFPPAASLRTFGSPRRRRAHHAGPSRLSGLKDNAFGELRGFQGLDHDILASILEAKSGFKQPRPDGAGAEPGEFGAPFRLSCFCLGWAPTAYSRTHRRPLDQGQRRREQHDRCAIVEQALTSDRRAQSWR